MTTKMLVKKCLLRAASISLFFQNIGRMENKPPLLQPQPPLLITEPPLLSPQPPLFGAESLWMCDKLPLFFSKCQWMNPKVRFDNA